MPLDDIEIAQRILGVTLKSSDGMQARRLVEKALENLSPKFRGVLILREIEGLSRKETSAALGLSVRTVTSRLKAGKSRLRDSLLQSNPTLASGERNDYGSPEPLVLLPHDTPLLQVTFDFQKLFSEIKRRPEEMYRLNPRQFEELVAELWSRFGYEVELTRRTRDGGRDIVAVRAAEAKVRFLIECKRYDPSNKVGVSLVRALYGVKTHEKATKAILATTSFFTSDSQEFFEAHHWELEPRDHNGVLSWIRSLTSAQ